MELGLCFLIYNIHTKVDRDECTCYYVKSELNMILRQVEAPASHLIDTDR